MTNSLIRKPAVAGQFYSSNPKKLQQDIEGFVESVAKKIPAKGLVAPHAGYIYSGGVAGKVYSRVEVTNRIIVLSPNHTGLGAPFSIMNQGSWELPFGNVEIDEDLANKLMASFPSLEVDASAHLQEHSLEVQLPFLQYIKKDFRMAPITIGHVRYDLCKQFGEAMAKVIQAEKEPILIVASSDMNHYQDHETTLEKDQWAIDEILNMDPEGLYKTVHDKDISMCGIIPTTIMLTAAKCLGAKKATLVDHKTSGDISGDYSAVVGYAGLIVS